MQRLSIIIPTLNEAACLAATLERLQALDPPAWEVLVVDGGSQDHTTAIAASAGVRVLQSPATGRAVQMNEGARQASGALLCFLHADTLIPTDLVAVAERALADPSVACAGFVSLMRSGQRTCWGVSGLNLLKTYLAPLLFRPLQFLRGLRLLFGDQVMITRRHTFWSGGGFDEALPLLEDGDLCFRLLKQGRIRLIRRVVVSSDRRVRAWGAGKAIATYLGIGILWGLGLPPRHLRRFYDDVR
ncbi:TIGR04283 family arsenosugar biosynthesis glycosyltransferase [Cyanobium sp. LEGE 06143]|uniref:TIGR04283 family arsenosugar biosynthesis glycosyltransferase n=1 Tax=Cyanobium sp. LEGE 06143 TaxID=945727 RepID=UPI001880D3AE|nr:TIGR04283 family arsenosugar biosynthesis glycosyltransferase [Cyanobium sp. LEGE 06143]MBE9171657.1 TIGR04283 family arsenosugar biosynthesis glycosyltransferase [Cyanobium sp. LEGE 06143]